MSTVDDHQIQTTIREIIDSVQKLNVEAKPKKKHLMKTANEFVHGLQKTAFLLRKAVNHYKDKHDLKEFGQKLNSTAQAVIHAIDDDKTVDVQRSIQKTLESLLVGVETLNDVDLGQKGGKHIKKARKTISKTLEKLQVNTKFGCTSNEEIKSNIDLLEEKLHEALQKRGNDNDSPATWEERHRDLERIVQALLMRLQDYLHNESNSDNLKIEEEVIQKLRKLHEDIRCCVTKDKEMVKLGFDTAVDAVRTLTRVKIDKDKKGRYPYKGVRTILLEALVEFKQFINDLDSSDNDKN